MAELIDIQYVNEIIVQTSRDDYLHKNKEKDPLRKLRNTRSFIVIRA